MKNVASANARRSAKLLSGIAVLAAVVGGFGASVASADTFTYTVPEGGIAIDTFYNPLANPFANNIGMFSATPYTQIMSVTLTNWVLTTTGNATPNNIVIGTFVTANDANDPTGATGANFNTYNPFGTISNMTTVGTSDPFTATINLNALGGLRSYVPASGLIRMVAGNYFAPISFGGVRLDAGSITIVTNSSSLLTPPAAAAPPTSLAVSANTETVTTLAAAQVKWFKFQYAGGDVQIDTFTNSLTNGDTMLALYDSAGQYIGYNDDVDNNGLTNLPSFSSVLLYGDHQLANGTYYIAMTGYGDNNQFNNRFDAISDSTEVGSVTLSLLIDIPGDYNGDGIVDAADYTVWADHFGASTTDPAVTLLGDGNGDGVVDAADYTVWADNFGRGIAPGSIVAVPEPTAVALLAAPAALLMGRRRR